MTNLLRHYSFEPKSVVSGNHGTLLVDGPDIFARIFSLLQSARHRIALEIYQFAEDNTGYEIRRALLDAAQRGCEVKVLVDSIGSLFTANRFFEPLIKAHVQVKEYHPFWPWKANWRWFKRDHRKMLLVDAQHVLIGGCNISDSYRDPPSHGGYHDVALHISGPVCSQAWFLFFETWNRKKIFHSFSFHEKRKKSRDVQGSQNVQIVANDHFSDRWRIRRSILYSIAQARKSIDILNPYFLPDPAIVKVLFEAIKRGVRIRVIVPNKTDVGFLDLASRVIQHRLLCAGAEIFHWPGFAHGKVIVIDEVWISVGSYNFDYRSLFHNLEIVVQGVDETCGNALTTLMDKDVHTSLKLKEQDWKQMSFFVRFIARILYRFRMFF